MVAKVGMRVCVSALFCIFMNILMFLCIFAEFNAVYSHMYVHFIKIAFLLPIYEP